MEEQLYTELKKLATAILNENKISAQEIKERAQRLYEQATILAYAEKKEVTTKKEQKTIVTPPSVNYINEVAVTKEEVLFSDSKIEESALEMTFESNKETIEEEVLSAQAQKTKTIPILEEKKPIEVPELLHELENLTTDFDLPDFEPLQETVPKEIESKEKQDLGTPNSFLEKSKVSLNDTLSKGFQVGLNDRLAFVNQLFDGNQQDYTRVISQLNTFETLEEAQLFINKIVKPEYKNWEGKEAFEIRFLDLIERNF